MKLKKHCTDCDTKYTLVWNEDEQDLPPLTCPFCGHEVIDEDDYETRYEEDEDWN